MSDQTEIVLQNVATLAEWQFGLVSERSLIEDAKSFTPFKKEISRVAFNKKDPYAVDAIYFSGENPFIHFKQLHTFDTNYVKKLHRKIWNEGRTPLLGIITPQEIRLYDCFDMPVDDNQSLSKIERGSYSTTQNDLKRLGAILHQSRIDSGIIWNEELGKSIKTANKVDRKLVDNLSETRKILFEEYGFPLSVIHDLLGRSLFTLYLEDRGILNHDNYPDDVEDFFTLLDNPENTINLFHDLKVKFNGDLFPVTEEEELLVKKNSQCLTLIKNCFSGKLDILTGQLRLWRIFQFQYIPIELISSIYEEFMSEEDENHRKIRKDGAFYTPQMLVEFSLNEVLPWPDENNNRYDLKILDPACGSGIFLVESYKRLIARWKYNHPNTDIDELVLGNLLLNNIFGIEKDPEAIKVTAFSLYLTFLNYLEPKKVLSQVRFEPLIHWTDKKELKEHKGKKPGNNLFQDSTFSKGLELREKRFDLIVGNPPWKLGKLDLDVQEYLNENKLPQQIMCAYLHYMPNFITDGTISLISAVKILFNTGKVYDNFRQTFFSTYSIDAIINLAVVRSIIFKNATSPGAIFIYKKKTDLDKNYITYCIPKSVEVIKRRHSIVIDASEVKFLPLREILKNDTKIFKVAMWGNVRDLKLIEKIKLVEPIKSYITDKEWGVGLKIKDENAKRGNPHLKEYPLLPTENIKRYYTPTESLDLLGERHDSFRLNSKAIFNSPIVLVKEGTSDSEFCSSFIKSNCVFLSSALGISIEGKDENFHKALVACLNSSIATYYFFITSSSWGIDKGGRVQNNDALSFPALPYVMKEGTINKLAKAVDEIILLKSSGNLDFNLEKQINSIEKQIDDIIYKELYLSENDKALIHDVLSYSVALRNNYNSSHAESFADNSMIESYAKTLITTLGTIIGNKDKGFWVEVIESKTAIDLIRVIALHFNNDYENGSCNTVNYQNISGLLHEINQDTFVQHSESIYYRKLIKYFKKDSNSIYLIKPNQKKFWTLSQALNDADNLILDLIQNN